MTAQVRIAIKLRAPGPEASALASEGEAFVNWRWQEQDEINRLLFKPGTVFYSR